MDGPHGTGLDFVVVGGEEGEDVRDGVALATLHAPFLLEAEPTPPPHPPCRPRSTHTPNRRPPFVPNTARMPEWVKGLDSSPNKLMLA